MRPESDAGIRQQINGVFDKGRIRKTIDRLIPGIPYKENCEPLNAAREILETNSLLVAMNHASYPDTFLATHSVLSALEIDQTTPISILISEALCRKDSKNPKAIMTRTLCSLWDIEMLPVFLAKKGWTSAERDRNNRQTIVDTLSALNKPNNIVIIFPEGNISSSLLEAERGLGEFITHTKGFTLPVTSNFHTYLYEPVMGKVPKPLVIHYPVSNKELTLQIGKRNGQTASDFILATIATALPEHQRGFYKEMSKQLENTQKEITDDRMERMSEVQRALFTYALPHEQMTHEDYLVK